LISVHKLLNRSEDDSWHESRLSVQLDEPDLAHVGWDDSGMTDLEKPGDSQVPDFDFDDLSATIRIHRPGSESVGLAPSFRVLPEHAPMTTGVGTNEGFPLSVGAGEAVFIKVTNRFRTSATIAVIEKTTGQMWWSYAPAETGSYNGDVCALENTTLAPREFIIVGGRNDDPDGPTRSLSPTKPTVRFQQDAFTSLLFDEGPDDPDFDDVKVDVVTMIPL
jgi:hypothetical protein